MATCKRCNSAQVVKSGFVRKKQRYQCNNCGYNFVDGDARKKESVAAKKALSVILYSLGKASFGFLGKLFGVSRTLTYRWIKGEAQSLPEPVVPNNIKEIEFDEIWHFIQSKKTKDGSSRPWIVTQGELSPGLSVIVMLQLSSGYTTKSSI